MKPVLILVALFATLWAFASWLTGFDSDFVVGAVVAISALGAVVLLDYRREWMVEYRQGVWDRRDAEAEL